MSMSCAPGGAAAATFHESAFRGLPLAVMAAVAAMAAVTGPAWSAALGPMPWIVSLGLVGLPHGAADLAASRRAWRGWTLVAVWLAYAAAMAAVAAGFALAPRMAIVAFAALSCWHFGATHLDADRDAGVARPRAIAAWARGCGVLALPLAAWPESTAAVANDLATLAVGRGAASDLFPPALVHWAGVLLVAATFAATALEGLLTIRQPGGRRAWLRLLVELAVLMALGWSTDPLFSVGLSFLAWHAWRQMEPLSETVAGSPACSWPTLGRALVRIHAAALPLLLPTWAAVGTVWWLWSPEHSPRDLAIVSIAAYLVVTPAHELLGDLLRTTGSVPAAPARPQPSVRLHVRREPLPTR